jgi:hypothetical protein
MMSSGKSFQGQRFAHAGMNQLFVELFAGLTPLITQY